MLETLISKQAWILLHVEKILQNHHKVAAQQATTAAAKLVRCLFFSGFARLDDNCLFKKIRSPVQTLLKIGTFARSTLCKSASAEWNANSCYMSLVFYKSLWKSFYQQLDISQGKHCHRVSEDWGFLLSSILLSDLQNRNRTCFKEFAVRVRNCCKTLNLTVSSN